MNHCNYYSHFLKNLEELIKKPFRCHYLIIIYEPGQIVNEAAISTIVMQVMTPKGFFVFDPIRRYK